MPEHPPDPPPGSEEPRTISDQQMVLRAAEDPPLVQQMTFTSEEASSTSLPSKKMARKSLKTNVKERKSTPAPSTKGDGRKRFVLSPMPEDKQLRKKIDFGEEDSPTIGSPKCKGPIFPASQHMDEVGNSSPKGTMNSNTNEEGLLEDGYSTDDGTATAAPDSDQQTAGDGVCIGKDRANQPLGPRCMRDSPKEVQLSLVDVKVKLPEMEPTTNLLSESCLVACRTEPSRELLAVEAHVQPKKDSIMQLANLDMPEMLDAMMVQPLLGDKWPADLVERAGPDLALPWSSEPNPEPPLVANGPSLEDFPPLERGRFRKIRDAFESGRLRPSQSPQPDATPLRATTGPSAPDKAAEPTENKTSDADGRSANDDTTMADVCVHRGPQALAGSEPLGNAWAARHKASLSNSRPEGNEEGARNTSAPKSMADMVRMSRNTEGPKVFEPDNIPNIGFASTSNGIPAIYFSGAEVQKLASSIGHAIVGKFSHSIPTSYQIQKALDNIKFNRGFTWKYINAKHIFVQFEDMADYARLLSGPKGTPVWFIDRHPMRVFKWSPDFDAYCESPIAAVWCNIIGLPIHLFDHAALFAIGKLLGTPIQVDRATANKSRLSFARIFIEIDITKPPPEEFILDICGRETVLKVKWDKIPAYCMECRHVGHKSEVCYAAGNVERPPKRNYNNVTPRQPHHESQGGRDKTEQPKEMASTNEWKHQKKNKGSKGQPKAGSSANGSEPREWSGPDIMGEVHGNFDLAPVVRVHEGGESSYGRETFVKTVGVLASSTHRGGEFHGATNGYTPSRRGAFTCWRGGARGAARGRGSQAARNVLSSNQYYSLMENEDFLEDDDELEGEGDKEGIPRTIPLADGEDPMLMHEEECLGEDRLRMVEFQGDLSRSPGKILPH